MALDDNGHEVLDPTPLAIPAKFKRSVPQAELIRAMVQREISALAERQGFESWDEANDFDVDDDPFPVSVHQFDEDQEAALENDTAAIRAAKEAAQQPKPPEQAPPSSGDDEGAPAL